MRRILITGVTGFAGGHLAERLLAQGNVELFGTSRNAVWPRHRAALEKHVGLKTLDLAAGGSELVDFLRATRPDQIYHLAGYASAGRSFREPELVWTGNLTATRRLYEAIAQWGGKPRILFVSTGLVYGEGRSDRPLSEDDLLRPISPYAASKAAADLLSFQFGVEQRLEVIRARSFNHIGPGQSTDFAIANFSLQLAEIAAGRRLPVLESGNLESSRDLTDVRDVVEAYRLLMERGKPNEAYNVASGKSYVMKDVLQQLVALSGVSVQVKQRLDPTRTTDERAVRAGVQRLRDEIGWSQSYSLEQTLADTLRFWKECLADPEDSVNRPA